MDEQFPITCQLDRKRLSVIESKQDQILDKLEKFFSVDGPIGRLKEEMIVTRKMAEAAHSRIDGHDKTLDRIGGRQWEIILKSAGLVGGGGVVGFLIIQILEKVAK